MNVGMSLKTNSQTAELMKPGDGPFNNPTRHAQATAVSRVAFRKNGCNTTRDQFQTVRLRIVSPVSLNGIGFAARTASFAAHRRNGFDKRDELGHIMRIGSCQYHGKRHSLGICNHMMFAPSFSSVRGIRAAFRPPKTDRTDPLSTTARDQSILSASRNFASKTSCTFCHTPASCHACRYRQHVMPEPQPISWGNISQGIPLLSTKRIPVNTLRRSMGLRPGFRYRLFLFGGKSGSTIAHSSSLTSSFAMKSPPYQGSLHKIPISSASVSHFVRGS